MKITDEQLDHFEEDSEHFFAAMIAYRKKWKWFHDVFDDGDFEKFTPVQQARADQFNARMVAALEAIE